MAQIGHIVTQAMCAATMLALLPTVTMGQGAAASQPAAEAVPPRTTFARSGRKVCVTPMLVKQIVSKVVLRAYGRTWTEPVAAIGPGLTDVPNVRVPTVFAITAADNPKTILGELVAYPDRDVKWDEKIALYSCGAPGWFNQWALAVGLPVKVIALADLPATKLSPADEKGKSLLLLGREAAGKDLPDVAKLARDKKVNVLVLEANWFGEAAGPVSIAPAQMLGGLAEVAKQHWPQPLKFASRRQPWPGIANRWAWVEDGHGLPLVEGVHVATLDERARFQQQEPSRPRVLLDYLPWKEQLGRSESADATFLALLRGSAQPREPMRWLMLDIFCPASQKITAKERPVLKAAENSWPVISDIPSRVYVVDARGQEPPPVKLNSQLGRIETQVDALRRPALLILGDDKLLDEWEWLKMDRAKKTIKRAGVVWLSDDELPPSKENRIRLMLKLTEMGVPLTPPEQKEKSK